MNSTASLESSAKTSTSFNAPSFSLKLTEPAPSLEATPSGPSTTVNVFDYQTGISPCPSDAGSVREEVYDPQSTSLSPHDAKRCHGGEGSLTGVDADPFLLHDLGSRSYAEHDVDADSISNQQVESPEYARLVDRQAEQNTDQESQLQEATDYADYEQDTQPTSSDKPKFRVSVQVGRAVGRFRSLLNKPKKHSSGVEP